MMTARSGIFLAMQLFFAAGPLQPTAMATGLPEQLVASTLTIESASGDQHGFTVRVASTPAQLARGLMFVTEMGEWEGMLFDFGTTRPASMWMRNTPLPLDMVFIRADGIISNIAAHTEPYSRTPIPSDGPVRYALEIHGGTCERLGIKAGDRVIHPTIGTGSTD